MVLLLILGIWAVVLLPPYLRRRSDWRPSRSILNFQAHISSLERTTPSGRARQLLWPRPTTAVTKVQARRRRQAVLAGLVSTDVIALAAVATGVGVPAVVLLVLALGLTAVDVRLLARRQQRTRERQGQVQQVQVLRLPRAESTGSLPSGDDLPLALPRSASG